MLLYSFKKNDIFNYFILLLYPRPLSSVQAWDTDQRRLPSCIERMGTVCILCGLECNNLEDLMRHRLADDHYLDDPIGPVQAPWLPPRGVQKVEEPCTPCRYSLEGKYKKKKLLPGDVCNTCDNATAGRCQSFCVVMAKYKRAIAQYRHEKGTGPPATAPPKKRPKKSDKTTKR